MITHSVFNDLTVTLLPFCFQADLNYNVQDDPAAFYGVTSQYESSENMTITCSTKVCSFGKQVVEKVEVRMNSCSSADGSDQMAWDRHRSTQKVT